MPMKRIQMVWILAFSFFCLGGISPQQLFAAPLVSTQADQTQVSLTIYNSNLGLVKDVRTIELAAGENALQFMDVAAQIMPTTVHIRSRTDAKNLQVLEQNYEYDLLSPDKLLEKYVSKEIKRLACLSSW